MTDFEHYVELPTFFAPEAFAETRQNHMGIRYDTDQLGQLSDFLKNGVGRGLPANPGDLTIVHRFGEPGFKRPNPDPNYHKAGHGDLYVPADQLLLDPDAPVDYVSKAHIVALGRPVVQTQLRRDVPPSAYAFAEPILYPPAEDHRMVAGPKAWARQFSEAFNRKEAPARKRRLLEEAAARFSGAVLLLPRSRAEASD